MEQILKAVGIGLVTGFAFRAGMHLAHKTTTQEKEAVDKLLSKYKGENK